MDDGNIAPAQIMNEYNFIGVTERFDESLVCLRIFRVSVNTMTRTILDIRSHAKVVLKWLLNLDYNDVLHVSAKVCSLQYLILACKAMFVL